MASLPCAGSIHTTSMIHTIYTVYTEYLIAPVGRLDNPEGGPERILRGVEDVTERKEAKLDMTRLAAVVESSEDAIIAMDLDGVIASWNQGAERFSSRRSSSDAVTRFREMQ